MILLKHHKQLDANGIGKCSVPMWTGGCPNGFCDAIAYGEQEKNQRRYGKYEMAWNNRWFHGYCGGLACFAHGGPKIK